MLEREECIETIEESEYIESSQEEFFTDDIALSIEEKKKERIQRYQKCTEPLNEELFFELRNYKLLYIDTKFLEKRNNSSQAYKNCFIWDINELNKLSIVEETEKRKILNFLLPSKGITNTQLENILSSNPNTLVSAMTILTNSYEWCIEELKSKVQKESYQDTYNQNISPYLLFTEQELTSFLLGRTMLVELNKVNKSEYIKELVNNIDGIICRVHQGLIRKYASELNNSQYYQELIQEGNIGVLRALQTYDIDRGLRFSTYVTAWIRQKQGKFLSNNSKLIREPIHLQSSINKYYKVKEELERRNSNRTNIKEVYAYCEKTGDKISVDIDLMQNIFHLRQISSLDDTINDDDGSTLMDIIPEKGETQDDIVFSKTIDEIFTNAKLNPREIRILKLRWGFIQNEAFDKTEHTLGEIGRMMGITRERARQIEKIAIMKIRKSAGEW